MSKSQSPEPMAIVGMGCRWAGGVKDSPGLWEFLINKRSGYQDWAAPRFSAQGFYHPNPERPGTTAAKGGYVVTEDPRLFDPAFFGISGLEAETIDASQRKLLEVVYEAFENAGDTWESVNGTRMGVYVADISYDNSYAQTRDWEYARPHATTGVCHNILSNRINYVFNLTGPSVTLDSACTSALYAMHMAIQAIHNGDCESAVVATANWIMDPAMQIAMDKLGALSGTSMSHAFDASADGYARGEGFAAIYLKKPEKAMRLGNPIRALVRGSAIGANGRSSGITHPSGAAQEAIIRKCYKDAGLDPSVTPFLECHGTGTRVGDPLEVEAAGNVFGPGRSNDPEDRLLIGSVKTNLGHTEGAAALAGIFKAVLALEAGLIPPSIGVQTLNPRINFDKAKAMVATEVMPWPKGKLRRASVTSAGFGGSIGHCILDHVSVVYPDYVKPGITAKTSVNGTDGANGANGYTNGHGTNGHTKTNGQKSHGDKTNGNAQSSNDTNGHTNSSLAPLRYPPMASSRTKSSSATATTRQLVLLPFSANVTASLDANIAALSRIIDQHSLADVAYTLSVKRSRFTQRTFCIVDKDDVNQSLFNGKQEVFSSPTNVPGLGFIFTGQGAQWHAMGAKLFEYQIFRSAIDHLDDVLGALPSAPLWKIKDLLSGTCDGAAMQKPEISQTACTAVQIGLVDLLASWSVHPTAVAGHSSGEMAAAYASGRITAAEAITVAYLRGRAVSLNKRKGAMLAVGLGVEAAAKHLVGIEHEIKIAAVNSPGSLTLSGEVEAIESLSATLTNDGVFNRLVKTGGNAYHSHHMLELGSEYQTLLDDGLGHLEKLGLRNATRRHPLVYWASSVTPDKTMPTDYVPAQYWRANLESPVRFSDAVGKLITQDELEIGAMIEIGPHPALKGPVGQIIKSFGGAMPYVASLKRGEDDQKSILQLAGALFGLNAAIDLDSVNATDGKDGIMVHGTMAMDLPPYQFTYGPVSYYESRASREFRLRSIPRHDLIGSKIAGSAKLRPQFRNVLRIKDLPWLGHHRLLPDAVFPAAGYMAMAMVAAAQVHNEAGDALPILSYSLRNVSIKSALKIPEDQHGIEIILSLELDDAATAQVPTWASFSVSSVARGTDQWTEHCKGLVRVNIDKSGAPQTLSADMDESRALDARAWYKTFASIGLGYGPAFQGLSDLRADSATSRASAKLSLNTTAGTVKGGESTYPIHPASLDAMIQLGLLACHGGEIERATGAFVPMHLSELTLEAGDDADWGTALAQGEFKGLRSAYLQLQLQSSSGKLLLNVKNLRCIAYSLTDNGTKDGNEKAFASPFTRMVYKPDSRVLSNQQAQTLFPPLPADKAMDRLETVAALVVVDIYETMLRGGLTNVSLSMRSFASWITRLAEDSKAEPIAKARLASSQERQKALHDTFHEKEPLVEIKAMQRLHDNAKDILEGTEASQDILNKDGLIVEFLRTSLYLTGTEPQISNIFDSIGHINPNVRILDIGAGNARLVLEALSSSTSSIKRYRDYTITCTSQAALDVAQGQLGQYRHVNFSLLDIEQDPSHQGFQSAYDVVFASQSVHVASNISIVLKNIKKLLKPNGKLVMVEATGKSITLGLVGGSRSQYWGDVEDYRGENGLLMSTPAWDAALKSAGFSGIDIALDDYPQPRTSSTVLVSSLLGPTRVSSKTVYLLHGSKGTPRLLTQLVAALERRGTVSKTILIDNVKEQLPPNSRLIAFLDGENLLLDADEVRLSIFQYLAENAASMMWLTSTGMAQGHSANGAVVGGLLRTLSTESPTCRFTFIDIDADDFELRSSSSHEKDELIRVLTFQEETLQQEANVEDNEDREFAWHSGCLWAPRLLPEPRLSRYAERLATPTALGTEMLPHDSQGPVRAAFETPGILSSLYFQADSELRNNPLPKDWIEVHVTAVGLNWKDLALCTGRFDGNNLSSEYAGVVTMVGSDINSRFTVGDCVYGLGKGYFGNYVRVPAGLAQKTHTNKLLGAATMPVVFMTAVYAFEHLTRLRESQKVLIQSASGGVGLAAIALARAKGAEVFAMAGSPEKLRFLVETVGLPSSHVFLGHDDKEMARAVAATCNGGFDVVLSTSQGDMLYETIKAVAPLGHLIDIGRLNVSDAKAIGLELFQKSASFSSFDIGAVVDRDPELGEQLMREVDEHYRAGNIGPIVPMTASDISQLSQTLQNFSKGKHVGKLIVTFQNSESLVRMVPTAPSANFDPEACYVVTGGLTGLGRSIIQWMGQRGVRHVAVLSRRGTSAPDAKTLIKSLAKRGVCVTALSCDLSKRDDVLQAIQQVSVTRTIKGIVHCAVSYQDISFHKLSIQGWRDGLAAKVAGTVNLHEATKTLPLDFFVMTTSILSVLSFATQSAYTAANNFQDQFARYRRRLGLPATAAQFGLVNDIGRLSTDNTTLDLMARNKVLTIPESYFLRLLEPAFIEQLAADQDPLVASTFVTYMDPAHMATKEREDIEQGMPTAATLPRWYKDARVSHVIRGFDDAMTSQGIATENAEGGWSTTAQLRSAFDKAFASAHTASTEAEKTEHRTQLLELVTAGITRTVASMLLLDISAVNTAKSVSEHGVDSLIAAELRSWFHHALGFKATMIELLDAQMSIGKLALKVVLDAEKELRST
ncbi:hypothetical protein VHEMI04144 [[Torrubiella] hemipterigena]|uniref:Uncharacterized protein n=1 Tax=[Torrubiella] hemipterigena TaxID=1531966 RepID=A0A0A1T0H7_9HYPO|nr:hypothetical protein VHEMI04144 [[Torrubiella] hemipterigena]